MMPIAQASRVAAAAPRPSDGEARRGYDVTCVRSVFRISNLFLRPRLWQFEI